MPRSPGSFLCATALVLACTAQSPADSPPVPGKAVATPVQDVWHGELRSYVVNDGTSTRVIHKLRTADGRFVPLRFSEDPPPLPGTRLRVWGPSEGREIRVEGYSVEQTPADVVPAQLPLVDGAKKTTRRWAFVLVDVNGGGNLVDKARAQDILFSPDRVDSIRSYFREVSHGVQDIEGEVFGPLPYSMNGCDTDELAEELLPKIEGRFDQYLWFFGTPQRACNWAGIAELGRAERPTRHSWFNNAHSCTVLVQEPGHNFGMVHSSAARCVLDGKPVPIGFNEQDGELECQHLEYGNPFDPMGGGGCFHMTGVQKAYQDWISGCNVVKATESGTFTIYPLESSCNGLQLLQVPFPRSRTLGSAGVLTGYYLELRAPLGRDGKLTPQLQVVLGNDVREARRTGNRNWLLDMAPETETMRDAALPVGQTFADPLPGGPRFTLLSIDAQKAVVRVELSTSSADPDSPGVGTCRDQAAFTAPGPDACVVPAAQPESPDPAEPADGGAPGEPRDAGTSGGSQGGAGAGGVGGQGGQAEGEPAGQGGAAGSSSGGSGSAARGGTGGSGRGRSGGASGTGEASSATGAPNPAPAGGGCAVGARGRAGEGVGLPSSLGWLAGLLVLALFRRPASPRSRARARSTRQE